VLSEIYARPFTTFEGIAVLLDVAIDHGDLDPPGYLVDWTTSNKVLKALRQPAGDGGAFCLRNLTSCREALRLEARQTSLESPPGSEIRAEGPNHKLGLFLAHSGVMTFSRTLTEKLATTMLARDGIAILWRLQIDAARAYRTGHPEAAAAILEIADAAEEAWLRTKGARIFR
jgi:hypothetical protein